MKKIYFVQVGFDFDGAVYLPYAAGALISCCLSDDEIKSRFTFPDIIFRREKLADALTIIDDPSVVAFSCSVWNMEYNKRLAFEVKKKYPQCTIVFGGHSVYEDGRLLNTEEYIDILMFGEGEQVLVKLLKNLDSPGEVKNIAYRSDGKIVRTPREYYYDISSYPSPYTQGLFDEIIKNNPDTEFLSVLETNRGCPYSCSYCDWCSGRKVRFFPMEKILGEIEWLARNKIAYCFCADSNFGMFERDYEIAKALTKAKETYGYPQVFRPCYEKNSADRVFKICSLLNEYGMDKGATMAYQTLSPIALKNIGRKNLTLEHFSRLMKKYNEAGIPTYSELILGLPGETKDSFCRGLCKLLENGQHNSVSVYHCEVLPNSDLSDEVYIKKHGIETIKVSFNHIHSALKNDEEVPEYSYLVRSTATMPPDDWVYSNLFSVCLQCFHSLGLLRLFAMYMHTEGLKSYFDFYSSLLKYIMDSSGRLNELFMSFLNKYKSSLKGDWNYHDPKFGNVTWFFEEGLFLEFVSSLDSYYGELLLFLEGLGIEDELFNNIMKYQRFVIRKPGCTTDSVSLDYDLPSYFRSIVNQKVPSLTKRKVDVVTFPGHSFTDITAYAKEIVWYGRRRGMTLYKEDEFQVNYVK